MTDYQPDRHDESCEAEFISPHGYTPCDCEARYQRRLINWIETGDPDHGVTTHAPASAERRAEPHPECS